MALPINKAIHVTPQLVWSPLSSRREFFSPFFLGVKVSPFARRLASPVWLKNVSILQKAGLQSTLMEVSNGFRSIADSKMLTYGIFMGKKVLRIYIENSVIGGYFDEEFREPTQRKKQLIFPILN